MIDTILGWFRLRRPHSRWCLENQNTVLSLEVAHLKERLEERTAERDYWKARAELFIDRAAAKAGISHEPVMRESKVDELEKWAQNPLAGMAVPEFDSTK